MPFRDESFPVERCARCDKAMVRACRDCGLAYCATHLVRGQDSCSSCAQRCEHPGCGLLSNQPCKRCERGLCASHWPGEGGRCYRCERSYDKTLETARKDLIRRSWRMAERLETAPFLAASVALTSILLELLPLWGAGLLVAGAFAAPRCFALYANAVEARMEAEVRRRFLAERVPRQLAVKNEIAQRTTTAN